MWNVDKFIKNKYYYSSNILSRNKKKEFIYKKKQITSF